jgi:hypothetical protein
VQPEWGRYDASRGTVLLGTANGDWDVVEAHKSGLNLDGQIRDIQSYERDGASYLLFSRLNGPMEEYRITK